MSSIQPATALGGGAEEVIDINDQDIRLIQEMRKGFIAELTRNGKLPSDMEDRSTLMTLMSQTTGTALASKKIKADEKTATSNAVVVQNMAEAIRAAASNASAARRRNTIEAGNGVRRALDVEEVPVRLVPGQTAIGCFPVSTTSIANGGDGHIER